MTTQWYGDFSGPAFETTESAFLRADSVEHINTFFAAEGARFPIFVEFFSAVDSVNAELLAAGFVDELQDAKSHARTTTEL